MLGWTLPVAGRTRTIRRRHPSHDDKRSLFVPASRGATARFALLYLRRDGARQIVTLERPVEAHPTHPYGIPRLRFASAELIMGLERTARRQRAGDLFAPTVLPKVR